MNVEVLVALETDEIMPIALVVAEKQILAMRRIYVLPVCKGFLDGKKWRMIMDLVSNPVCIQPGEGSEYLFRRHIICFQEIHPHFRQQ